MALLAILCATSVVASFAAIWIIRRYAIDTGLLDTPNDRSSHATAPPRGGGLGLLLGATVAIALGCVTHAVGLRDAVTLGIGAWALGILGWIDDHRSLPAASRFMIQIVVAAWTLYRFGGLPAVRAGSWTIEFGWFGYVIGTVGLVWSINLFNFMDGIDALAGSQAALIFSATGLLLLILGDTSLGIVAGVLAAAAVGFLPWNWPRARIFLGDVGSAPLGYLVASLAIASENRGEVPLLAVVMMSAVFVGDATVTLVRRLFRGERLSVAHRNHAYQRLARAFASHGIVSAGAAVETTIFALLAIAAALNASLFVPEVVLTVTLLAATLVYAEWRAPMTAPSTLPAGAGEKILDG